ncbi:MAG: ACT domain-containing protein [Bulleidia sp.]
MKAVITVVGKDRPGILAFVSGKCADSMINIVDVTQKVLQDLFTMIMIVEIPETLRIPDVAKEFDTEGTKQGLKIQVMQEDIFNAMHTI